MIIRYLLFRFIIRDLDIFFHKLIMPHLSQLKRTLIRNHFLCARLYLLLSLARYL